MNLRYFHPVTQNDEDDLTRVATPTGPLVLLSVGIWSHSRSSYSQARMSVLDTWEIDLLLDVYYVMNRFAFSLTL